MRKNRYIRFDWAAKYMLRSKADFVIFEGLISALVGEKVTIVELLESESNQDSRDDKFNRVDIKAKNSKGEIVLVEILQIRELDILEYLLYDRSYQNSAPKGHHGNGIDIKKVYSIIILYFEQGDNVDFTYRGKTILKGISTDDIQGIAKHEIEDLGVQAPEDVFPEYYVIRVNEFDQQAVTPLEEWLQYLKDEYIRPDTTVPGLKEARERLEFLRMSDKERSIYEHYLDTLVRDTDVMKTKLLEARIEGQKQGRAEGIEKGRAEERLSNARSLMANGVPKELIIKSLGLSDDELSQLE